MSTPHYRGDSFLIVRGASGPSDCAGRPVFVFQCYLDDSGTSGFPIVTMAGFVAPISQWEQVETILEEILTRYGVSVLHAKDFNATKADFRGWSKIKKRSLAEEMFSAIHGCLFGLSVTMPKDAISAWKCDTGDLPEMSPLGMCFAGIMMKILTDDQLGAEARKRGVAFLVESGNKHNSGIEKYFHRMSKQPAFEGTLRSISFIAKNSCRAIQVADFFAYYSRRYMRDHARFAGRLRLPMSPYLATIQKHLPIWQWGGRGMPERTGLQIDRVSSISEMMTSLEAKKFA